jgi:hypothetical protein
VDAQEPVSCPFGKIGRAFHTCKSDGQWDSPDFSGCDLPTVGVGEICGGVDKGLNGLTAKCPSGTTCQHRSSPTPPRDLWCAIFGINCPTKSWTADWYCDP